MSELEKTIELTRQWFHEKGIIGKTNPLKQLEKTQEELTETRDAIVILDFFSGGGSSVEEIKERYMAEAKDGIGDTIVTLIGVCEMLGTSLEECLQLAYGVISKRSGKMVNGIFVKDE
jgi:NTP pyrophosphatase (non-canonical NTP hydrolase)